MEPIDSEATTDVGTIDVEAEFESFAEEVLGIAFFADFVMDAISENDE